jgi:glutamine cyclotransferase
MFVRRIICSQGLTLYNGYIYEGTGLYGSSEIRKIDPKNPSHIIQSKPLPSKYFGEGITLYKDSDGNSKIIQLTWKEQTAFVYDPDTLDVIQQFEYETSNGEGWGITFLPDTCELVVSDGSHYLIFWDCDSFQETRRVEVRYNIPGGGQQRHNDDGEIVNYINELEVIKLKNEQYAILTNVWFQDVLLQIDPLNGHVDKIYSFADSLYSVRRSQDDVFNGISVSDDNHQTLYLTGKMWPFMYKVQLKK